MQFHGMIPTLHCTLQQQGFIRAGKFMLNIQHLSFLKTCVYVFILRNPRGDKLMLYCDLGCCLPDAPCPFLSNSRCGRFRVHPLITED